MKVKVAQHGFAAHRRPQSSVDRAGSSNRRVFPKGSDATDKGWMACELKIAVASQGGTACCEKNVAHARQVMNVIIIVGFFSRGDSSFDQEPVCCIRPLAG